MKKYLLLFSFALTMTMGQVAISHAQQAEPQDAEEEDVTIHQLYLENLQLKNQLLQYQLKLQQLQNPAAFRSTSPIPIGSVQQFNSLR